MLLFYKRLTLFCFGGGVYTSIELLWRGFTHAGMFFAGGLGFMLIGLIAGTDRPFWFKCLLGGLSVTCVEFIAGCILNLWLGMGVWDYSTLPLNLFGQICFQFTLSWCVLSAAAMSVYSSVCTEMEHWDYRRENRKWNISPLRGV